MVRENEIENLEIRLLLEAIYERYGYDLRDYSAPSMRRRVRVALAKSGLGSFGELQHAILSDESVLTRALDDLTVRVTSMFRDPAFYQAFRAEVVPVLRTYPSLKIWHSGCATGEEVYGTAILLAEDGLYERAQIYATDLSARAVEHAKQGLYAVDDVDELAERYASSGGAARLSDYYTPAYGRIAMRDSLRKNVLFFQHNLVSDYTFAEMNVIFCRNVLIYFGPSLRDRVLRRLAASLCPRGFLCLGTSERMLASSAYPFTEVAREARIYRHEP